MIIFKNRISKFRNITFNTIFDTSIKWMSFSASALVLMPNRNCAHEEDWTFDIKYNPPSCFCSNSSYTNCSFTPLKEYYL